MIKLCKAHTSITIFFQRVWRDLEASRHFESASWLYGDELLKKK